MTETTNDFADLLALARGGDREAMAEIVRRYEPDVRLVARLRLGKALRMHLDSVDLVQSVHHSLMVGLRAGKFELHTPQQLVALALTIVRRKAARHWQRMQRQARLSDAGAAEGNLPEVLANLSGGEEDPARAAAHRDTVEELCRRLDPTERRLLLLHLEGFRTTEVAEMMDADADVLRVKLSRLRQKLRAANVVVDGV